MKLTAARRRIIYVITVIATPVVVYLRAKDYIGDLELALWGAEVSTVTTLAGVKTTDAPGE